MAAWYFLIYLLVIPSCLVAGQSSSFGLKGGKAFLKTDIAGHPDEILWKFKGNKVVEFNGQEQRVYGPYENRITLNWVTAELTIAQLRLEDSGDYKLEVLINKELHTSYYALDVMDKVSRPIITCTMNGGGSLNISGELVCSAEHQPSLKFEWGARGKLQLGPQLQVPLGDEHDDEVYSCSVSNQLSKETTTFTAKDCYTEESSSVAPITIAVIIIVLVLLVVCVATFWLKRHKKACFAEDDLEKQSSPGSKEGSNQKEAQSDEKRNLVHRESTLPSKQKLLQGHKYRRTCSDKQNEGTDSDHEEPEEMPKKEPEITKQEEMPNKGHVKRVKKCSGLEGDADAVQPTEPPPEKAPLINQSDSVEEKDPEPAGVSDHVSEDEESSPKGPESPEHPSSKAERETPNKDKDDHHEGDADAVQPSEPPQEKAPLINQSDSVGENDPEPAGVSDHVSEGEESSPEGPQSPEHPEEEAQSPHVDASMADQALSPLTKSPLNEGNKDPAGGQKHVANSDQVTGESAETKVGESDSSGEEKVNESSNTGEDKTTSTDCEQKVSRTSTEPEENNTNEESDKGNVKPGTEGEATIDTKAGESHQPQSQSTKPDHSNTDPGQQSSDAARTQPDEEKEEEECKTCPDSHDTEGKSDKGKGKNCCS